ncbi:MAG: ABC transporter ATP-binding protein [Acidimicrobiaceae bacterium]|nr:ABC transporter ATP-binding protein [Acidimicrobiaceae bacterium]
MTTKVSTYAASGLLEGDDDSNIVTTRNLTKKFGDRIAVNKVSLAIPRGIAFGYLGPNGAGKTTLIRMLLGLTQPTSGEMVLRGYRLPSHRSAALSKVGAIIEEPRFHPHLTGRENLEVFASVRDKEAFGRISGALERVGLGERATERVRGYSLGMRQRLGIARCLLSDPELLILDEPMNGLDPGGILEFRHLIRSFVDEGRTVVISSHLLDEIEKTCDAVAIVDSGQVVKQGNLSELTGISTGTALFEVNSSDLAQSIIAETRLTLGVTKISDTELRVQLAKGIPTSQITKALVDAGIAVESILNETTNLEDEFLAITNKSGVQL